MVSRLDAEHYLWGGRCDGWRLVSSPDLSVIEERMPAGTEEVRHFHTKARQFFYVLRGEAHLEVDGEQVTLRAGEGKEVPPGAAHQMMNRSAADVEFLVVSTPPAQGDRVAAPLPPSPPKR